MAKLRAALLSPLLTLLAWPLPARWTNRYPRLAGFGHHVYVAIV
jgi:hypothetical protein